MKLVTYSLPGKTPQARPGMLLENMIIDLQIATEWAQQTCGLAHERMPASLLALIQAGLPASDYARQVLEMVTRAGDFSELRDTQDRPFAFPQTSVCLLPPIQPVSLRDAYAFEDHVRKASENRGRQVPPDWYKYPAFYYTNAQTIIGHESPVHKPRYTQALDFELEIAAVIGTSGIDLDDEEAASHIFGFTIFNDWSARDVQLTEMKIGLGPAKGKDFASSLGPCILTIDELADCATDRPGVFNLGMTARINGQEKSRANFSDIYWSFGQILARISQDTTILPGEVIGSGTVGTGCLLELTKGLGPWLQPGDLVELEVERIGILRNQVQGTPSD